MTPIEKKFINELEDRNYVLMEYYKYIEPNSFNITVEYI